MYKLYWHPSSSSYAPLAVLEEIGQPFELHEVDYDGGENLRPEYLRMQPLGLVPALRFGGGGSMFESAAIVLYLSDRHSDARLAPSAGDPARPAFLQWLFYLSDTLYPSYNRYYHPERFTAAAQGAGDIKTQAHRTALKQWQVVESALQAGGPWLLGERFSACDIYAQMITTWHETPAELLAGFPNLRRLAEGVLARDGCRRAFERHDFDAGFTLSAISRKA